MCSPIWRICSSRSPRSLPPGRQNDWLYTGRAFALNPVLIDYEYMLVVKEEFGPDTYWRIFLKPLDQSGEMGMPLTQFPWDFDARFSGSPAAYENGGDSLSGDPRRVLGGFHRPGDRLRLGAHPGADHLGKLHRRARAITPLQSPPGWTGKTPCCKSGRLRSSWGETEMRTRPLILLIPAALILLV